VSEKNAVNVYYVVNGITFYRLLVAPFLIFLVFTDRMDLFKWLLAVSFFTDLIDGYLARLYKVTSVLGSRLDSVADDLTIVAALTGLFVFKIEFILGEKVIVVGLLVLYLFQNIYALARYHKISSFHTYSAKAAALLQGFFLILIFLLPDPIYILFYAACLVTAIDLIEEIILVFILPEWKTDVKGLYWVLKRKNN